MDKNKYIDHTLLKPDAGKDAILKICAEAKEHDFASVMINPCWISLCKEELKGTDVMVGCVIGFPLGAMTTASKVFEAKDAVANGADEVDMVLNIGQLKDGNDEFVIDEIRQIKEAIAPKVLKVIIEACLLTDEEKARAAVDVVKGGADFVKTSTGFSTGGATVHDVEILKSAVEGKIKVKAAGGIRTPEDFEAMIKAGAERIGTSNGCKLV